MLANPITESFNYPQNIQFNVVAVIHKYPSRIHLVYLHSRKLLHPRSLVCVCSPFKILTEPPHILSLNEHIHTRIQSYARWGSLLKCLYFS